jgi:hypothetical protein
MSTDSWSTYLDTVPDADSQAFPRPRDVREVQTFAQLLLPSDLAALLFGVIIKIAPDAEIREYPGEIESRVILVTNIAEDTTVADFAKKVSRFGDIDWLDTAALNRGIATVKFPDLRCSHRLRSASMSFSGRLCIVRFGPSEPVTNPKKPPNAGTLVVFRIGNGVDNETVSSVFGRFGDIREIRDCPQRDSQRFVEFWDQRSAEKARNALNKKFVDELNGHVVVDFSRPGGFRTNISSLENNAVAIIERPKRGALVNVTRPEKPQGRPEPSLGQGEDHLNGLFEDYDPFGIARASPATWQDRFSISAGEFINTSIIHAVLYYSVRRQCRCRLNLTIALFLAGRQFDIGLNGMNRPLILSGSLICLNGRRAWISYTWHISNVKVV